MLLIDKIAIITAASIIYITQIWLSHYYYYRSIGLPAWMCPFCLYKYVGEKTGWWKDFYAYIRNR